MASTSAPPPRNSAAYGRIASPASTLFSNNQTLIAESRRATVLMKEIAVDLETDNYSDLVKEFEDGVLELVKASDDCTHLSNAIQSIGNGYQPGPELTNFRVLFEQKTERLKLLQHLTHKTINGYGSSVKLSRYISIASYGLIVPNLLI